MSNYLVKCLVLTIRRIIRKDRDIPDNSLPPPLPQNPPPLSASAVLLHATPQPLPQTPQQREQKQESILDLATQVAKDMRSLNKLLFTLTEDFYIAEERLREMSQETDEEISPCL